jgi:hypothetical protein
LRNHAPDIAAMDLFVVPTIGFDLLYAFVIVRLDRRDLVWINVTANPTAEWVARQITEAFPWDEAPHYLIRDRDRIYGSVVTRRLRAMGIRDKPTAPASPWQNGFAEQGKGVALILPACNTEAMNLHLAEIAKAVAPGAHAVLLVDQAGWHLSARLLIPANITILALPPKCPELNPVENIWQYMRDNWLSNRIFKSYDDIVDHCCHAWNTLLDRPWKIMSIGLRQWAHGF